MKYTVGSINHDGDITVQLTKLDESGVVTDDILEAPVVDVQGLLSVDHIGRVVFEGQFSGRKDGETKAKAKKDE